MPTKDELLGHVRESLTELFEIDPVRITPEARLDRDLELDSIDAIDLMEHLRRLTGRKVPAESFRSVRTVGDLVDTLHRLLETSTV